MNSFYMLALLLTADEKLAEQCFSSALKDCLKATGVFKNWAASWARRAIVQNAIRLVQPSPRQESDGGSARTGRIDVPRAAETGLAAVAGLPAFERFVFVTSVLEGYSDQECRILLGCLRHEVAEARMRALAQIGEAAEPVASLAKTELIPPGKVESSVAMRGHRSTQA